MSHLEHLRDLYSEEHYAIYSKLEKTLDPRGPGFLHGLALSHLGPHSRLLDVGCRDGAHLVALVRRSGCEGAGLDPLAWHVTSAQATVRGEQLQSRITVVRAVAEAAPFASETFDVVWCRDVLSVLENVRGALHEIARVLRPGGKAIVYTNYATQLLEPGEAARLHQALGNVPASMDEGNVESAIELAGLVVQEKHEISTEWREFEEERTRPASDDLLKLARLRRQREALIEEHGQPTYEMAEASLHWLTYQLLGKLEPVAYVLGRA